MLSASALCQTDLIHAACQLHCITGPSSAQSCSYAAASQDPMAEGSIVAQVAPVLACLRSCKPGQSSLPEHQQQNLVRQVSHVGAVASAPFCPLPGHAWLAWSLMARRQAPGWPVCPAVRRRLTGRSCKPQRMAEDVRDCTAHRCILACLHQTQGCMDAHMLMAGRTWQTHTTLDSVTSLSLGR